MSHVKIHRAYVRCVMSATYIVMTNTGNRAQEEMRKQLVAAGLPNVTPATITFAGMKCSGLSRLVSEFGPESAEQYLRAAGKLQSYAQTLNFTA